MHLNGNWANEGELERQTVKMTDEQGMEILKNFQIFIFNIFLKN
jgi:hypothetical protein